ncbi:MAG TPA: hypothetical protein VM285_09985 [Polyangia bacterium]|nr:hypothetical protein [Polyangia bacterium]
MTTEAEFQGQVTEVARLFDWEWVHFRPARTAHGWATPVEGPLGTGFPDLILVRGSRLIFAELKSDKGKLTVHQEVAQATLSGIPCAEVYVWRPRDFDDIVKLLR